MKYTYTATFTPKEDGSGYYCRVPDLPGCISSGSSIDEAIDMITDAACGWLCVAEDEGLDIAAPTPQHQIQINDNDCMSLVRVDTLKYRARTDTRSVRKNVSLPAWMSKLADQRSVNCSQVLQDSLLKLFENS